MLNGMRCVVMGLKVGGRRVWIGGVRADMLWFFLLYSDRSVLFGVGGEHVWGEEGGLWGLILVVDCNSSVISRRVGATVKLSGLESAKAK